MNRRLAAAGVKGRFTEEEWAAAAVTDFSVFD
jgi:hypothetical protein